MEIVIVSSRYRVVIPKKLRCQLNIKVGQKLKMRVSGAHIELISDQRY